MQLNEQKSSITIKRPSTKQVSIGLTNPKSPTNVGAVMRAAGCYQVDQVFYTGKRYELAAKHNKDTLKTDTKNVQQKIPLQGIDNFIDIKSLAENISPNAKIICVDLVEGAIPLPAFVHPDEAIYIFGPEDGTIKQAVIDMADDVVYVPTVGCMNLAASVNVLLYDRLAKSLQHQNKAQQIDNDLIRQSRDTNNKVKVKDITSQ
ncbi:RNA methyltransferase [Colwellia asteriadis]|uniref:RNA methyltransferase n=1 Tax=Colwellia asteriadis TaxID=517723 RepID=A0ABN1L9U8_9GAMM